MDMSRLQELVAARSAPVGRQPPPANTTIETTREDAIDPARLKQMMADRALLAREMPQPTRPDKQLPEATKDKPLSTNTLQQRIHDRENTAPSGVAGDLFEGTSEDASGRQPEAPRIF
jgi:hypothetical protein